MKFVTGNNVDTEGTCLQGYVDVTYERLVAKLGKPRRYARVMCDGENLEKVQVEWAIKFEDGKVATIYDWKDHRKPEQIGRWHIGGRDKHVLANVLYLFGGVFAR